jgi:hypothetical protein
MKTLTLAEKLETTTHVSALLQKARRLGLDAEALEQLAIQRGCDYYHEGEPLPPPVVSREQFSDEELAITLLNPSRSGFAPGPPCGMDSATLILQTLDGHLDHAVRLILYGRAALQLGFKDHPTGHSKDVDCIIPMTDLDSLTADAGFWDAQQAANDQLRPLGLYITHLFPAQEVFLRRDWEQHLVSIPAVAFRHLRLFPLRHWTLCSPR